MFFVVLEEKFTYSYAMARPLRIQYPGALYHVMARGNAQLPVFEDDDDRQLFLQLVAEAVERYHWMCHAYCLMGNHYHLLIETPDPNLSLGMRHINGVYTQRFNRRHARVGHLFQGRYKSVLVQKEEYLLELSRYIMLNPVRAGVVEHPEQYAWSSYRASVGLAEQPEFLFLTSLLDRFADEKGAAQKELQLFVEAGMDIKPPEHHFIRKSIIGTRDFALSLKKHLKPGVRDTEVPKTERFPERPALEDLFAGEKSKHERNQAIKEAFMQFGYTQQEIADHVGMHYSWISRLIKMANKKN